MIAPAKTKGKNISYSKLNYASFKNGINADYDSYLTPITYSKNTFNYSFKNGALKTGLGVDALKLPKQDNRPDVLRELNMPEGVEAVGCWVYERYIPEDFRKVYDLIMYGSDNIVYWTGLFSQLTDFYELLTLQKIPNFINYRLNGQDSLIMTNDVDGMYVFDSRQNPYHVENAPKINSMCIHYERLFATVDGDKSEVWFSDDLDPTNWNISLNEGGFVSMIDERGSVNKVISFKDYIYVFRDYGIARITAFSKQTEFNVSQLFVSSAKIYAKTVCVCGDRVLFLATDGVYIFDGSSTTKVELNINKLFEGINNDNANAAYFNGKYYLACKLKIILPRIGCERMPFKNNMLLEIDVLTGELTILRGVDIINMHTIKTETYTNLMVCARDNTTKKYRLGLLSNSGKIFDNATQKLWESPFSDFGYPHRDKVMREIYVVNKYPFTLTVKTEKEQRLFHVNNTKGISCIRPYLKGKMFALNFASTLAEAEISNPQVVIGLV